MAESIESSLPSTQEENFERRLEELTSIQKQLEEINQTRVQGAVIRCRLNWLEHGEKIVNISLHWKKEITISGICVDSSYQVAGSPLNKTRF